MTAAQAKATFGTSPDYQPAEFPKAGRNAQSQSAVARDPDQQKQLEVAGFVFPEFFPHQPGGLDHNGNRPQEFPKAMNKPGGKTAVAKNPDHQTELEKDGWSEKPFDETPAGPQVQQYGPQPSNPPMNDAVLAELTELRSTHSAKLGELQNKLIAEQKAHKKTATALEQVESDKAVLQKQLDKAANKSKAELQGAIDALQAEFDALQGKYSELNMAHEQLLQVVGKPAGE